MLGEVISIVSSSLVIWISVVLNDVNGFFTSTMTGLVGLLNARNCFLFENISRPARTYMVKEMMILSMKCQAVARLVSKGSLTSTTLEHNREQF